MAAADDDGSAADAVTSKPRAATATATAATSGDDARLPSSSSTTTTTTPSSANKTPRPHQQATPLPPPLSSHSGFASPLSSRDSSPSRPSQRATPQAAARQTPSPPLQRKHSADRSPHRNPPALPGAPANVPSAAAIQRALSATSIPQLQPTATAEPVSKIPRAQSQQQQQQQRADDAPVRLKSPPPTATTTGPATTAGSAAGAVPRRSSLKTHVGAVKKAEIGAATPSIVVQSSTPTSSTPDLLAKDSSGADHILAPQPHRPLRAERGASGVPALATVEEGSNPSTPGTEQGEEFSNPSSQTQAEHGSDLSASDILSKPGESGSDSADKQSRSKGDKKAHDLELTPRPKSIQAKSSYTSLASIKPKSAAEPASRKMTVETETVSAAAQSAIGGGDRVASTKADANGSLRLRASNETIRPRKDRKKARKAPSMHSGTASSKADIFEAKVASAVDDVDSSDSDETFVYESNPPDSQPRRSRHHSRTPSATSMVSMADPRANIRSLNSLMTSERGVSGKRSMKFANNPYSSSGADDDSVFGGHEGTMRGGTIRPSAGSSVHHHHMSRLNRGSIGPAAALDDESTSPFTLANKKSGLTSSRTSSRPSSPRIGNVRMSNGNGTSRKNEVYATYDLDGEGADDERTPLMGTVRTPRSARTSRVSANTRYRHPERLEHPRIYWVKRFAGCAAMFVMIIALVLGAVGFFFITTKPLYDVDVRAIKNVLASEQEIMLDLQVEAVNPNLMTISIGDMDVNVFAKSKFVGSEKWWRDHGKPPPFNKADRRKRNSNSVEADRKSWFDIPDWDDDDDDYRPPGAEGDQQMMLLGRVLHFDNALTFSGSPIKRHMHYSVGEFRVSHPGNKTEAGGTERWERVLKHPFQLIVRGILKYNLPLSSHPIAAPIDAVVMVHPEDGIDDTGSMRVGRTRHTGWRYDPENPDPFFTHIGVEGSDGAANGTGNELEAGEIPERSTYGSSAKFRARAPEAMALSQHSA